MIVPPNKTTWAEVSQAQSLEQAQQGQQLRVRSILFDSIRSHCLELGIREGDLVNVVGQTPAQLTLSTASGRVCALPREVARFIQVVPDAPGRRYAVTRPRPGLPA